MESIQHQNATTTHRIRKEIQESSESLAKLAKRYGLNPKTVAKWRARDTTADHKSGPKNPHSTVLTPAEEQIICAFRRTTQLPLDDVLMSMKKCIPALTRSNLHRCLVRHGLNVLPRDQTEKPAHQKFADYPVGYVHIDITEVRIECGKYYVFVGIERKTKYAYVEIHDRMTVEIAVAFLKNLIADCPFIIHRILTDNGAQFTYALLAKHLQPKNKMHPFDVVCHTENIKHKLIQFRHPWTNGQVEIFNKTMKNYTTKKFHYATIEELKHHLMAFILVYNFRRPLRALKYKTPYDKIIELYNHNPELFKINPTRKTLGRNK